MNQEVDFQIKQQGQDECVGPDGYSYVKNLTSGIYEPYTNASKESSKKKRQRHNRPFLRRNIRRKWFALVVPNVIGLATFFIVTAYTYFAGQQVYVAETANFNFMKSSRDNDRTVALTLQQMQSQASIAAQNLQEIKNTDRAFVFVQSVTSVNVLSFGKPGYDFFVNWQNGGTTTTRNLKIATNCGTGDQFGKSFSFELPGTPFRDMIGPRSGHTQWMCGSDAKFVVESATNMQKHWYIYGRATYEDVFGKHHMTEFCWEVRVLNDTGTIAMYPSPWENSRYNCADDECPDFKDHKRG